MFCFVVVVVFIFIFVVVVVLSERALPFAFAETLLEWEYTLPERFRSKLDLLSADSGQYVEGEEEEEEEENAACPREWLGSEFPAKKEAVAALFKHSSFYFYPNRTAWNAIRAWLRLPINAGRLE